MTENTIFMGSASLYRGPGDRARRAALLATTRRAWAADAHAAPGVADQVVPSVVSS